MVGDRRAAGDELGSQGRGVATGDDQLSSRAVENINGYQHDTTAATATAAVILIIVIVAVVVLRIVVVVVRIATVLGAATGMI